MSAEIITDAGKKMLQMDYRSVLQRPFNVGTWTEINVGFLFRSEPIGTTETVAGTVPDNIFAYGIKDASPNLIGTSGTQFVGAISNSTSSVLGRASGTQNRVGIASNNQLHRSYNGASVLTSVSSSSPFCSSLDDRAGAVSMRFVVNDAGLSTQTISFNRIVSTASGVVFPYNLLAFMEGNTSTGSSLTWNDGAAALPIPTTVFFQWPFFNYRPQILEMRIVKNA